MNTAARPIYILLYRPIYILYITWLSDGYNEIAKRREKQSEKNFKIS